MYAGVANVDEYLQFIDTGVQPVYWDHWGTGIAFIPPQITILIVYKYFIDFNNFIDFFNFIDFIDNDDDTFARTTHISASSSGLY